MVYAVQRHGARNVLPKSAVLQEGPEYGGPVLLPQGELQAFRVGAEFRTRYIDPAACSANDTCLLGPRANVTRYGIYGEADAGFHTFNLKARSSGLVRTIMTAESFLAGVFPPDSPSEGQPTMPNNQQVVPVFSAADSEDYLVRGYSKCDAYQARLARWFESDEFARFEADTAALRASVAALDAGLDVRLENWWNVYDAFDVWRAYGAGGAMPNISDVAFREVETLANAYELAKMRRSLTGNLLGGAMLGDLLAHIQATVNAVTAPAAPGGPAVPPMHVRLVTHAAHYNTILGLLSAVQADERAGVLWPPGRIPATAALVAFELHRFPELSDAEFHVRAVYQDGPGKEYGAVPLPCAGGAAVAALGEGACTLEAFAAAAAPQQLRNVEEWCAACGNGEVLACRVQQLTHELAAGGSGTLEASGERCVSPAVFGVIMGFLVALAVTGGVLTAMLVRARRVKGCTAPAKLDMALPAPSLVEVAL